ncbi:L,D-transpeptidase family protein [Proteobacteria bacterium 005FR1]|nr:L,D-transpeptidase family protein [Proteobacteria bacterium 005FR1]
MMRLLALLLLFAAESFGAEVDLVRVAKSENRMYLYDGDKIVKEFHVALGANPKGHKEMEGDERTPEGIYTLDYIKEDSYFYRSMHISYPNEADRESARERGVSPGGLIMIHGHHNHLRRQVADFIQQFNWTDGCIALTNPEMDEFLRLVRVGTKIHIHW